MFIKVSSLDTMYIFSIFNLLDSFVDYTSFMTTKQVAIYYISYVFNIQECKYLVQGSSALINCDSNCTYYDIYGTPIICEQNFQFIYNDLVVYSKNQKNKSKLLAFLYQLSDLNNTTDSLKTSNENININIFINPLNTNIIDSQTRRRTA